MSNEAIRNDNSVTLDWSDITSTTLYHIQVSKTYIDFRSVLLVDDATLAVSTKSFTATGNGIYYWRIKPYISSWQPWREFCSFIVNTSLAGDISATGWALVNKSDSTDYYLFEEQPLNQPTNIHQHYFESSRRNRAGSLITEFRNTKDRISLSIGKPFLGSNQKAEIMRFHNLHTSFYLVTRYSNQLENDYVYRAWECIFSAPPQLDIAGGTLEMEEI